MFPATTCLARCPMCHCQE
eukprot:SM003786S14583  [mRNA]  locus=s3786:447:503:+ [translate_table: standard]